jgi:hypothetical protein
MWVWGRNSTLTQTSETDWGKGRGRANKCVTINTGKILHHHNPIEICTILQMFHS